MTLRLTIATPSRVLVDDPNVVSLRAEDDSGGFGVRPGHADLVTVLPSSVVRWRGAEGPWRFCAVSDAVFSVAGGAAVNVACRRGLAGDDLDALQGQARRLRDDELDADRRARVEQTRLHAQAIRRLMQLLRPAQGATLAGDGS
jgi:F-type H+-transporting ATPase subunit epsilon